MTKDVDEVGPVRSATERMIRAMCLEVDSVEWFLGELSISLASAVDAATRKGSAASAAQASRELRDAVAQIVGDGVEEEVVDPLTLLVAQMQSEVAS